MSSSGLPFQGASIELSSIEFDASISDWIAQGRIAAPPGGLRTDTAGKLRLDGLPRGNYIVTATAPGGSPVQGPAKVEPAKVSIAVVGVP